ncbi:MAG: CRISPR-associated protein [Firmicutes bacterium]|nr:CRISPR-associated protein [Bacillota bacterium]
MFKIQKKKYYKITFEPASPLAVGSGENRYTDSDIIKDSCGNPYIPASAIAGVQRALYEGEDENLYFGVIRKATGADHATSEEALDSRIIFYDAKMCNPADDRYYVSKRDSVALDKYKAAVNGAKFDIEVLEPGVTMVTYMEENIEAGATSIADELAQRWLNEEVYFGAKTMRGYGAIKNVKVFVKEFDLSERETALAWLDFDMYDEKAWASGCTELVVEKTVKYEVAICLKQVGGISIRRYTTNVSTQDETAPDYEQLTVHTKNANDKCVELPVIPGTSWSGAFRHRMMELLPDIDENTYFGVAEKIEKKRSLIRFSETVLEGAKAKVLSRNSIDRFSAGTSNGALFTEKTYFGGTTTLKVSFTKCPDAKVKKAFAATVADLNNGFLAVGGLTAVGRGLFTVEKIGETPVTEPDNIYDMVLASMDWEVAE